MTDKLWKVIERRLAEYLGGTRVPITGRQRGSAPDIEHKTLSIEVKHRASLPDWIRDAMAQAVASKINDKQIPIVFLHEKQMRTEDIYSVIKARDLKQLLENYNAAKGE